LKKNMPRVTTAAINNKRPITVPAMAPADVPPEKAGAEELDIGASEDDVGFFVG
jgi:hypothetical protein